MIILMMMMMMMIINVFICEFIVSPEVVVAIAAVIGRIKMFDQVEATVCCSRVAIALAVQ